MKRIIFVVLALAGIAWGGSVPQDMSVKTLTFEDGIDLLSHQTLTETDVAQRINVTNYGAGLTDTIPVYSGTGTSWVCTGLGDMGLDPANTITVAKSGGDYDTVQAAVDAASSGDVILIFPGTYAEQVTVNKSDISLVGVVVSGSGQAEDNNHGVIITYASSGVGTDLVTLLVGSGGASALTKVTLENLTVINTQTLGVGAAQIALDIGRGDTYSTAKHEVFIKNCSFYGEQDTIFVNSSAKVVFDRCYFHGYSDVVSVADNTWFFNCRFYTKQTTQECVWVGRTGDVAFTVYFVGCEFDGVTNTYVGVYGHDNVTLYFYNCRVMPNCAAFGWREDGNTGNIYLWNTNGTWSTAATWLSQYNLNIENDVTVGGDISFGGTVSLTPVDAHYNKIEISDTEIVWESDVIGGLKYDGKILLAEGGVERISQLDYDVNLYHGGADILKTDDAFSADSLISNTTVWRDFSAVAAAQGNVAGYNVANTNVNPYSIASWMVNANNAPTYLHTDGGGACVYFPIPYLAGSVLTRARVKWQAVGDNDGVKLRIVKRDESGTATAWTVVGAQQTYTDAGTPYDVTVSTYDFADEMMAANTAYAIEVESEKAAGGVNLYSAGIETSKRVY